MPIVLVIALLLSCKVYSADVTFIDKGTPAPYSGHLFTESKAREIRKELIEKDQLVIFTNALLQNEVRYKKIISNNQTQVELLMEQNEKLVKRVEDSENMPTIERVMWFSMGVLAAGLVMYGTSQIVN